MIASTRVRRLVFSRRTAWVLSTRIGRYLLRRQVAKKRARIMRVVGGVTVTSVMVLVLLAEREAARQKKRGRLLARLRG